MSSSFPSSTSISEANGCKALEQSADLQIYIKNTFRVTGLPVLASEKDIKKRTDRQKMLEKLGHAEDGPKVAYPLLSPATSEQITAAIQRLKNPELRMVDEFFWFLPESIETPEQDLAYQAVLAGDQDTAFQIWTDKESSPSSGSVAKHNLAVLFHLTALDWTDYQLGSPQTSSTPPFLEVEREQKIRGYWTNAITRWKQVVADERIEEYIKRRIRALDDPRLTTGFGRRFFESLPSSIARINAEIALRFVKTNRSEWAVEHIQFMNELGLSRSIIEKISAGTLSSLTDQIRLFIKTAEEGLKEKPETGEKKAEKLISDCSPLKKIYDLFLSDVSHYKTDLFDEVASAAIFCSVQYQIKTGDNQSFVRLLKSIRPLACGAEVIDRIDNNIKIGENNIAGEKHQEIYKEIDDIRNSKNTKASDKVIIFKSSILKKLVEAAERDGALSESMVGLYDACAIALRSISIDAYNNENAFRTSLETINLAATLAKDADLIKKIKEDTNTVEETIRRR
jgi:hypothetical protein